MKYIKWSYFRQWREKRVISGAGGLLAKAHAQTYTQPAVDKLKNKRIQTVIQHFKTQDQN